MRKNLKKNRKSLQKIRGTTPISMNSTYFKIDKIYEEPKPAQEEVPKKEPSIISEINHKEEDFEAEVKLSKSDDIKYSEESIPNTPSDQHFAMRTRGYENSRFNAEVPSPKIKLIKMQEFEDSPEERTPPSRGRRLINERIMTPMKMFASIVKNKVENSYLIQSELLSTVFLLGIVILSLVLAAINFAGKSPPENFYFPQNGNFSNMIFDSTENNLVCKENYIKVGHLCALEEDFETIHEIITLESDFDELIQNFNPCENTGKPVIRQVNNAEIFKSLIENDYYNSRISYTFLKDTDALVSLHLKERFKVTPSMLNTIKCKIGQWAIKGNYTNFVFLLFLIVATLIAGYAGNPRVFIIFLLNL